MIFEPQSSPRMRYNVEGGVAIEVKNLDTGEAWTGPEAQDLFAIKTAIDAVAVQAASALAGIIPDFYERRLDAEGVVVFTLPVEHAGQYAAAVAAALSQIAAGDRLAAVWA